MTGIQCYWKVPAGVSGVEYQRAADIDFSSAIWRKKQIDAHIDSEECSETPRQFTLKSLPPVTESTKQELCNLITNLRMNTNSEHVIHKVVPDYCDLYKSQPLINLPSSYSSLFKKDEFVGLSLPDLREKCSGMTAPKLSEEEAKLIEEKTRLQADCPEWFAARAGKITASNCMLLATRLLTTLQKVL